MRRWVSLLLLFVGVFTGLRFVHVAVDRPAEAVVLTQPVVVVGVTDRARLTPVDARALEQHLGRAQFAMMSTRTRYLGQCAAAGWTTLGAGRRAAVSDGQCRPRVAGGRVVDWPGRQAAAAADRGDAQLGTLRRSVAGCLGSVGPGAALAAAGPDGTVDTYRSVDAFLADQMSTPCPITLVDAGDRSDQIISALANRDSLTLIVTGIGPTPGTDDPGLQVVYRLGTTFPGWLTSSSTRREGVVTLTDLTRTLIDVGRPDAAAPLTVDGSPLAVDEADLSLAGVQGQVRAVTALSEAAVTGYLSMAAGGSVLFVLAVVGVVRRRFAAPRLISTLGCGLLAAMMLTGSLPWPQSPRPGVFVSLAVALWAAVMTAGALLLGRLVRVPAVIAAAGLSVTAFTVDAALGGPMQAGSLINSRPVYGLRWYGFGNVTFAAYASAGLLLAGYLAHRLLAQGRRRLAGGIVAAIGLGIVICEGWPTMGSDFGGVIALTPPVLWLALVLSGIRVTWPRLLVIGAAAVLAVGAISVADWARGPDRRSHLGNFVQRLLDGDAADVVTRKAVASAETIVSPLGIGCLVVGIPLWFLMFRYAVPLLRTRFTTLRSVLLAALATAILGTLLNDGGIGVWLPVTAWVTTAVGWFVLDEMGRAGWTKTIATARDR